MVNHVEPLLEQLRALHTLTTTASVSQSDSHERPLMSGRQNACWTPAFKEKVVPKHLGDPYSPLGRGKRERAEAWQEFRSPRLA